MTQSLFHLPRRIGLSRLLKSVESAVPGRNTTVIAKAYACMRRAHCGQKRASGEPYEIHPLTVAWYLSKLHMDLPTIAAGLLHDVLEDTTISEQELRTTFGPEITRLIQGATKVNKVKYRGINWTADNIQKLFLAMARDIRVVFIKCADRIHNLQTLFALPKQKQQRIALESLEIYAPLAHRLSMWEIQGIFEDCAFPYLFPRQYARVVALRNSILPTVRRRYFRAQRQLRRRLPAGTACQLREKGLYSLYQKLQLFENDIHQIHDTIACRLITGSAEDCYRILGILHAQFRPMNGRVKDYIGNPKPNGFQMLKTTVFDTTGAVYEFQICTREMHHRAEYGASASWLFRSEFRKTITTQYRPWLAEIAHAATKQEFNVFKTDILHEQLFVFDRTGKVYSLPDGASPIDFVSIFFGAQLCNVRAVRINERTARFSELLKSGDVIDIYFGARRRIPRAWFGYAKTPVAQERIGRFFGI